MTASAPRAIRMFPANHLNRLRDGVQLARRSGRRHTPVALGMLPYREDFDRADHAAPSAFAPARSTRKQMAEKGLDRFGGEGLIVHRAMVRALGEGGKA